VQGTNCGDNGATVLSNLKSLIRTPDASPKPFIGNSMENHHDIPDSFHFAEQVHEKVHAGDMEVLSAAYVMI
jgi:predicted DNA-binding protein